MAKEITKVPAENPVTIHENLWTRLELISTIVLDGTIIAVALIVRAAILYLIHERLPPDAHNWAITALEWIADSGMVGTALAFTGFDLVKRVILAWRSFVRLLRDE